MRPERAPPHRGAGPVRAQPALVRAPVCRGQRPRRAADDRPRRGVALAESADDPRVCVVGPDHPVVAEVSLTAQGVLLIEQGGTKRARDVLQRAPAHP